jgi:predicted HTH domain antitoxin
MQITVQLPDNLTEHQNPGREALEALVIEGFSSGTLTSYEAQVLLGFQTRFELDGFLKEHNVEAGAYGEAEYEQDLKSLQQLDAASRKQRSA